jgi:uncharacterized membrane protein
MEQSRRNEANAEDHAGDNPGLNKVIERNIRTIIRLRLKADRERSVHDRIADTVTAWSGRMVFVYVHVVWFGLWILLNTGWGGLRAFDPFPYGLLTMIVSLEAIFLSTVVLISQNRLGGEIERRADLALHIGLLTEHELTRVLQMLDAIQRRMGIDDDEASELADLEMETKPEDVLAEIERLQRRTRRVMDEDPIAAPDDVDYSHGQTA